MEVQKIVCSSPLLFAGFLIQFAGCRSTEPANFDPPRVAPGVKVQDVTFHSAALNRDMPYRVFLPTTSSGQESAVVYLLHGGNGAFRDWSNFSDVSRYADYGLILVMPEGEFSYYMNAAESARPIRGLYVYRSHSPMSKLDFRWGKPAKRERSSGSRWGDSRRSRWLSLVPTYLFSSGHSARRSTFQAVTSI